LNAGFYFYHKKSKRWCAVFDISIELAEKGNMKIEEQIIQTSVGIEIFFVPLYRPPLKKKKKLSSFYLCNQAMS